MPPKRNKIGDAKRLAKGVRADQGRSTTGRARKDFVRSEHGGDAGGALGHERELSPLARLIEPPDEIICRKCRI